MVGSLLDRERKTLRNRYQLSADVTVQVYRQLRRLAEGMKHPKDASIPMYYTASWDWRRDVWAEAPRIMRALRKVHEMTGCKAIMAGHSFGGRMLYTVLAVRTRCSTCLCPRVLQHSMLCCLLSSFRKSTCFRPVLTNNFLAAARVIMTRINTHDCRMR